MKTWLVKVLGTIDFGILAVSACLADSETIIPLVVCCIATFLLIPIAIAWKGGEEDAFYE